LIWTSRRKHRCRALHRPVLLDLRSTPSDESGGARHGGS
jgi:hypothetical protein